MADNPKFMFVPANGDWAVTFLSYHVVVFMLLLLLLFFGGGLFFFLSFFLPFQTNVKVEASLREVAERSSNMVPYGSCH